MSKAGKLLAEFKVAKGQFKWDELIATLRHLGFSKMEGTGSRACFTNGEVKIQLHKPRPQ